MTPEERESVRRRIAGASITSTAFDEMAAVEETAENERTSRVDYLRSWQEEIAKRLDAFIFEHGREPDDAELEAIIAVRPGE